MATRGTRRRHRVVVLGGLAALCINAAPVATTDVSAQFPRYATCMVMTAPAGTDDAGSYFGPDTTGSNKGKNPQLDLIEGDLTTSDDGHVLIVKMVVNNLTDTVPPGYQGEVWLVQWVDAATGLAWYADAFMNVVTTAATPVTYEDGSVQVDVNGKTYYVPGSSDTGSVQLGAHGVIEVDVPLEDVGDPSSLRLIVGRTFLYYGVPPNRVASAGDGALAKTASGDVGYVLGTPYDGRHRTCRRGTA